MRVRCLPPLPRVRVSLSYGFSEAPGSELDSAVAEIDARADHSSSVLQDMLKLAEPHRG